jgi:hypothetical protein
MRCRWPYLYKGRVYSVDNKKYFKIRLLNICDGQVLHHIPLGNNLFHIVHNSLIQLSALIEQYRDGNG